MTDGENEDGDCDEVIDRRQVNSAEVQNASELG